MQKLQIDVEGLSDNDVQLVDRFVQQFVGYLKESKTKTEEQARKDLQVLWKRLEETNPDLSEEEIDDLAEEAVAWARSQKEPAP